jgi:hypothetical protein
MNTDSYTDEVDAIADEIVAVIMTRRDAWRKRNGMAEDYKSFATGGLTRGIVKSLIAMFEADLGKRMPPRALLDALPLLIPPMMVDAAELFGVKVDVIDLSEQRGCDCPICKPRTATSKPSESRPS